MKLYLLLVLFGLSGCTSEWTVDLSNVNSVNNPVIQPTIQYAAWTNVRPGVDFKQVFVTEELFDIVRINPSQADITVLVDEAAPKTISEWQDTGDYSVVINASYFDEQYELVTRTVADGQSFGPLLSGQTGSFTRQNEQWIITQETGALSTSGVQSYPMLVLAGAAQVKSDSTDTAQRTVVAVAADGLVYFIVSEYGGLTLTELSAALASLTDPNITAALNFDGGTSTGLAIDGATVSYLDDSLIVPSVVAVR